MSMFNISELFDMKPDEATKKMNKIFMILCGICVLIIAVIGFFIGLIFPNKCEIIIETVKIALGCVAIFSMYISFINLCLARKHKQTSIEMEKKNKAIEMIYK